MVKRTPNKERKRAELVNAAKAVFFAYGYAATTMTAIAKKSGGSKATLWAHFSSKEEIFTAVINEQIDAFMREIHELTNNQTWSMPDLQHLYLRLLDFMLQESSLKLFSLMLCECERFKKFVMRSTLEVY